MSRPPDVLDEQMMLPGETSEFETSPLSDTKVEMMVDPVLSQVRTLALGIGFLLPDEAVDSISRAECLPDLINSGAVENNPSATGFASVLRCFGAAVGGAAGAVVGLLAAAPAALWSQLEGLLRTATGSIGRASRCPPERSRHFRSAPVPRSHSRMSNRGSATGLVPSISLDRDPTQYA